MHYMIKKTWFVFSYRKICGRNMMVALSDIHFELTNGSNLNIIS